MNSAGYRTSQNTPYKQQSFEAAIGLNIALWKAIQKKAPFRRWLPYCYIDLHAGPGRDENGHDGSPLIFLKLARQHGITYKAYVFERDMHSAHSLRRCVVDGDYPSVEVRDQEHQWLLNETVTGGEYQYGTIYADPSNADVPWGVLKSVTTASPRMDVMINLACASYKRLVELPDYVHFDQHLFSLKKCWFVREPVDRFQWSILIGTNWAGYPDYKKHRFHSIETDIGREILWKLAYTRGERGSESQLGLGYE